MKYYIIAGEASGDLHGSNLMKSLFEKDSSAQVRFWGGDLMQKRGGHLVKHYKELAFMGFLEVAQNLKTILNNIKLCKNDIIEFDINVRNRVIVIGNNHDLRWQCNVFKTFIIRISNRKFSVFRILDDFLFFD